MTYAVSTSLGRRTALPDSELVALFLGDRIASDRSPATIRSYKANLDGFAAFVYGRGATLSTATELDIRAHQVDLMERGYKKHSVNMRVRVLRMFYGFLVDAEALPRNPATKVKCAKINRTIRPVLKADQIAAILSCFNTSRFYGARNRMMTLLMLSSMLRVSECCSLIIEDYNVDLGYVTVRNTKTRQDRLVPIDPLVAKELNDYLHRWRSKYPGETIFCHTDGDPVQPYTVRRFCYDLSDKLGYRIWPHLYRHTGATGMLQNGGSLKAVQEILGHANIATTMLYLHPDITYISNQHSEFNCLKGVLP